MRTLLLIAGLACCLLPAPAGAEDLVQSELDHLEVAARRISVELENLSPREALALIAKKGGLSIEVRGVLAAQPKLQKSFDQATVKEILDWFSREVSVIYHAEKQDKLVVLPAESKSRENG